MCCDVSCFFIYTKYNLQGGSPSKLLGLELLDAIVDNCLQWLPSSRPTTAYLQHFLLCVNARPTHFETPDPAASQLVAPLTTTKPLLLPSLRDDLSTKSTSSVAPSKPSGLHLTAAHEARSDIAAASTGGSQGSKTSQVVAPTPTESTETVSQKGNAAYGPCEVEGCTNHKLRRHIMFCWAHRDRLLPSEMVIARALQNENILNDVLPCDLVSCVSLAGRCQSLYGGFLPFAVVSVLKVPSASLTFVTELEKASKQDAVHFVAALAAASSPQHRDCTYIIMNS